MPQGDASRRCQQARPISAADLCGRSLRPRLFHVDGAIVATQANALDMVAGRAMLDTGGSGVPRTWADVTHDKSHATRTTHVTHVGRQTEQPRTSTYRGKGTYTMAGQTLTADATINAKAWIVRVLDCTERDTIASASVRIVRTFYTYNDAREYASALTITDADVIATVSVA